jgi:uncharacterized protein YjbI with pentapeptide repeats/energy-coupling factor transporter ATP-binding protein EcfA2
MAVAVPAFADVRPRVIVKGTREAQLLDEVLPEIVEDFPAGLVIAITGPAGSGKSTALAHAAAVLAHRDDVLFLDEPSSEDMESRRKDAMVVATMPRTGLGIEMALEPWRQDELIEYLLARHHDECASVIRRLGPAANWMWAPQLACVVLERFAANKDLNDPNKALLQYVDEWLANLTLRAAVEQVCVTLMSSAEVEFQAAVATLMQTACPTAVRKLLAHDRIRLPLAARRLIDRISRGVFDELQLPLPYALIDRVGTMCREKEQALEALRGFVGSKKKETAQSMAASILVVADPAWQPRKLRRPAYLAGAILPKVRWSKVNLFRAWLGGCDFSDADLAEANFEDATAADAGFPGADLRDASFIGADACRTSFRRANLSRARLIRSRLIQADFTEANLADADLTAADLWLADLSSALLQNANLTKAKLVGAQLNDADLSGAILREAELTGVDLRNARLAGACFEKANLTQTQLEDVQIPQAQMKGACLKGAHLTGSSMPGADLQGANLKAAGLAEIEWENADLRGADLSGATFHMGSSRSGLVNSPIACEGSRTGFYTDDFDDMTFKRPEEVRKANLRAADLRGAVARAVDFYLVDLRDAKLDPDVLNQARQTGAILEEVID